MNTNFGPYSIRNLRPKSAKVAANGYTATLLRNGHPVANLDCGNAPDNDDLEITFFSQAEMDFFKAAALKLYTGAAGDDPIDESFLRDLVEHTYHMSRLDSLSKRSTVFRLDGDQPNTWRLVRAPYRPALEAAIRSKFPTRQVQFARQLGS